MQIIVGGGALVGAVVGQFQITAPDLPQVVQRGQGRGGNVHAAFFAQVHKGDAFMLVRFREGILQRGAAVAQGVAAHLLGAVQVAQGHIVKGIEQGRVHAVQPAHGRLFTLAGGGTGHELVGSQQAAVARVRGAVPQHAGKGVVVALNGFVRPDMPHGSGLQKGQ